MEASGVCLRRRRKRACTADVTAVDATPAQSHITTTFELAAQTGSREYASAAKLALAQVHQAMGKNADAEKVLRELIASPSVLVSREQALFTLARVLAVTNPDRKSVV